MVKFYLCYLASWEMLDKWSPKHFDDLTKVPHILSLLKDEVFDDVLIRLGLGPQANGFLHQG